MRQVLKVSTRNIRRNLRRTIITVFTILVGVFVVVVIQGFINGLHYGLIDNITLSRTGDIQIHDSQYLRSYETMTLQHVIAYDEQFRNAVDATGLAAAASPRLGCAGLISNQEQSTMFIGLGVEPDAELAVCPKLKDNITQGRFIRNDGVGEAVLAAGLADSIGVKVGDVLLLLAQTKEGALNAIDVEVVGLLTDRLPLGNNKLVFLHLDAAQRLLLMPGEVTEVAVKVHADSSRLAPVTAAFATALKAGGATRYAVDSWDSLAKVFKDIMSIQLVVFWVIKAVLLIIVTSSIVNTMVMSVYERIREIGTMIAIGFTRRDLQALFVLETVILGIIGGVVGLVWSSAIVFYFHRYGFTYTAPGTTFKMTIFPFITLANAIFAFFFAIACSLLSSIYPAYKASRLQPTEALRAL